MSSQQMELSLRSKAERSRRGPELADELAKVLATAGGQWLTRSGLSIFGFTDREVRLARQHSRGRILFGQKGYKLTTDATLDEIRQAAGTLESQAKVMMDEARDLWRVMHGR